MAKREKELPTFISGNMPWPPSREDCVRLMANFAASIAHSDVIATDCATGEVLYDTADRWKAGNCAG